MKNFLLYFISFLFQRKLNKFKDANLGEECYIIGDGVSVKWFDLKQFSNKISIIVGFTIFHNDFNYLNSKYILLAEPYWFYPFIRERTQKKILLNNIQKEYRKYFRKNRTSNFIFHLSNFPVINKENTYYLFNKLPKNEVTEAFYNAGINPFHGSFRCSIYLAIFFGFSKIYLVGFDYTHSPSVSLHWYEKGEGVITDHIGYEKDFIRIAKQFIQIITVIKEGKSEKIASITYSELTGDTLRFRENVELLPKEIIKSLSTWPDYKV